MNTNSKITLIEKIIMIILVVSSEAVEFLAVLLLPVPVIGQGLPFIAWFYGITISAIMIFWLYSKGASTRWFLGGSGIELIPVVNALPLRTAALVMTFVEDSAPEKLKPVLSAVTGKAKPSKWEIAQKPKMAETIK